MSIPNVEIRNGKKILLVDGEPFVLLSGELHNSSSSTTAYMEPIWDRMKEIHLNSLLFPVTWQQLEPAEGTFRFELIDGLIEQAKSHGMKIGILWFGSWKNAACSYAPDWVKTDMDRFPRAEVEKGRRFRFIDFRGNPMPYTTLSAFGEETVKADAKAFAALCRHLKEYDRDRTVILIQVENETGVLGASRDNCGLADAAFAEKVPKELIDGLLARGEGLEADIRGALEKCREGSWSEVFGEAADEVFMAYHTAKYIETVAAAGKAEYPLPMYANCWLVQGGKPGDYPSGGPVYRVMEVYQTAAPSLDWLAPDIYVPEFVETCDRYVKQGNPLFIPEIALHSGATARLIYAVGHHHALCFAPFGIDDIGKAADTSLGAAVGMNPDDADLKTVLSGETYGRANRLLGEIMPLLTARYGTSELQAVIREDPNGRNMDFEDTRIAVHFDGTGVGGACLAARTGPDEYFLLGYRCAPRFESLDGKRPYVEFLSIEEGSFAGGTWETTRLLNGDEEHVRFDEPAVLRVRVHLFD